LLVVSPEELPFASKALWLQSKPGTEPLVLLSIAAAAANIKKGLADIENKPDFARILDKVRKVDLEKLTGVSQNEVNTAAGLLNGGRKHIYFVGPESAAHPDSRMLISILWNMAVQNKATLFPLELESNQMGWEALHSGMNPEDYRRKIESLKKEKGKALIAAGPLVLPEDAAPEFIVALAAYPNDIAQKADVILPLTAFGEDESLYMNSEGRIQKTHAVLKPEGEARPAWWIAAELARKMGHSDFDYAKGQEVRKFMVTHLGAWSGYDDKNADSGGFFLPEDQPKAKDIFLPVEPSVLKPRTPGLCLAVQWTTDHYLGSMFSDKIPGFGILRNRHWIELNPGEAGEKGIKSAEEIVLESKHGRIEGVARLDNRIPAGMVKIIRPGFLPFENKQWNLSEVTIERKK
jgi:predicted molibdopterin-dependent oxidoreductase YjgC